MDEPKTIKKLQRRIWFLTAAIAGLLLGLVFFLFSLQNRMNEVADLMESLNMEHIRSEILVTDTVNFNKPIQIDEEVEVGIDMTLKTVIPYKTELAVTEKMLIPIRMGISDLLHIDTTIQIIDEVAIQVSDSIPIDQKLKMFGPRGISAGVYGKIPLSQELNVRFDEVVHIQADVPFDVNVEDNIPVDLDLTVPIDLLIPIEIPINSNAMISFIESFSAASSIPISLEVPVDIPMSETGLSPIFSSMAAKLRKISWPF